MPPPRSSSFVSPPPVSDLPAVFLGGLIPVGAYLVVHLLTNASILNGPMTFQEQVDRIHSLGVVLPLVEWTFIFIPILFHAAVGWLIISGAVPNANSYPYASNIRYVLQRATGIIAFFFIVFHVIQLHHLGRLVRVAGQFEPEHAASSTAVALERAVDQILYAIGMLSCVYPLRQRTVDPRHHLGPVDQRRGPAAGQLCGRRGRHRSGRVVA